MATFTVPFPDSLAEIADPALVGGKAHSLIRLAAAGFPVPPGVVLSTTFFDPWFESLVASDTWRTLLRLDPDGWAPKCDALKRQGLDLPLSGDQQNVLEELCEALGALTPPNSETAGARFAVRSSSPEEDLASASFAGGYETCLGVPFDGLEDAIRRCFVSALDVRVLRYKREQGFEVGAPRIAVVVQQMIAAETAGVGFSLNPLSNDYDEAVIDANWGLGESVVSGQVTPDHFVVDKIGGSVLESKMGAKQTSIWLGPDGGTFERAAYRTAEWSLSDAQAAEVTQSMCQIETLYGLPVDIEWAYAAGRLHVLQARPITTYVPLPAEMVSAPDERRVLYADIALSGGFAINAPISPMGLAWMEEGVASLVAMGAGRKVDALPFEERLWFFSGARMYQNLSNVLWLASPEKLAKSTAPSDALMAEILSTIDVARYRAPSRPRWARLRMLRFVPRILWWLRRVGGGFLRAMVAPERAFETFVDKAAAYEEVMRTHRVGAGTFAELRQSLGARSMRHIIQVTGPALAAGLASVAMVDAIVGVKSAERKALADKLKLGFPGNVVADMGVAMNQLAQRLGPADREDLEGLANRIETRHMPGPFLEAWDAFLATYGWRGPSEMDLAHPRYADDPRVALRQIVGQGDFDPQRAQQRQIAERRAAYETLLRRSGWLRRLLLRRLHRVIECFAGTRDTPKHHNLLLHRIVRQRALIDGARWVRAGRLDAAEDILGLTFDDLESAERDPALDLRKLRTERTRFFEQLQAQVKNFPAVIDSRGRILRPPPRKEKPGELTGMAISPGVVSGSVNVLNHPDEKPVRKGDILVAYATDPGWTPLFANAGAVVLEIGGMLQHGAVVAREYGKPCVAGIDQVTTKLRDGQQVEVDGSAGVVRLLH